MVKKLFSFFLIGILLVHLAGFYVYFVVRLGEIRMTMREQLAQMPVDLLDKIIVPRDEFRSSWMEEREMQWNEKMYDIARVEPAGDSVIIFCKQDKDEEDLLSFLAAVVEMSSEDSRPAPTSVTQFFTLEFVITGILCPSASVTNLVDQKGQYIFYAPQVSLIPTTPPPQA